MKLCTMRIVRGFHLALTAMLLLFIGESSAEENVSAYVDVHMHLDGVQRSFVQQDAQAPDNSSADQLIALMNKYGVLKAIVMPPPQVLNQPGGYTYKALLKSVQKYPNRLVLGGGGGILNPIIQGTEPGSVTPELRSTFQARAEEIVKGGAHVFGEMTALHLCMNPRHHYQASPPDHPLFLLLADLSARYNIPIDLHMEAIATDIPTPQHLLCACNQNPSLLTATLPAFKRLLDHNRGAKIIWQHIGWDNSGQITPALLRTLLAEHPNLYLAIKAAPEPGRINRIHDDQFKINPDWMALFEAFPDRIVVGADEFVRSAIVRGGYKKPPFFEITWRMVQNLPAELRSKIGKENAMRIYHL